MLIFVSIVNACLLFYLILCIIGIGRKHKENLEQTRNDNAEWKEEVRERLDGMRNTLRDIRDKNPRNGFWG